jgi:hypothetical protein
MKHVKAEIVHSTLQPDICSIRATDGHVRTLKVELTRAFSPGDRVVILRESDYRQLVGGADPFFGVLFVSPLMSIREV